jgi:aminopeptidase N
MKTSTQRLWSCKRLLGLSFLLGGPLAIADPGTAAVPAPTPVRAGVNEPGPAIARSVPMPGREERLRWLVRPNPSAEVGAEPGALGGPRSAEDDYDLRHVRLQLDLTDTTGKVVHGAAVQKCESRVSSLHQVVLDLIDAMQVDTVRVDGLPATFTHAQDLLTINLPIPLGIGQSAAVRVAYHGRPPQDGSGMIFDRYNNKAFIWTLSEPLDARRWWPCKNRPDDKADSSRVEITVASWMTATSNGLLESAVPGRPGTMIYTWRERHPIAPYLICATAGDFRRVDDVYHQPGGGDMPVQSYVFPDQVNWAQEDFSILPDAIGAFGDRFGLYPFLDEKYGITVFGWSGGMEHQTNTSLGWFLIGGDHYFDWINVHELSHQWWGDNITCATWADTWLNEGFASWCEAVWYEHVGGAQAYRDYMNQSENVFDPSGPVYNYPDPFDGNTVYNKGGWVVHMLRGVLGDSLFFQGLREYRSAWQGRSVTTEQFRASMESTAGRDLGWFFDEWVYGVNRPHYLVSTLSEPSPTGRTVYVHLDQTQTDAAYFTMPVRIRIAAGGTRNFVLWNDPDHEDLAVSLPAFPANVTVDPDSWILRTVNTGPYHLNLISADLPPALTDTLVSVPLIAKGGTLPYAWQALDPPPSGISLDPQTGILAGIPVTAGDYLFRVRVGDASVPAQADTQRIRWTILSSPAGVQPSPVLVDDHHIQIAPNPAAGSIHLMIATGSAAPAEFRVYDLAGRLMATGRSPESGGAGVRTWVWDGRDSSGRRAAAGLYWVSARVTGDGQRAARGRVLLLN